MKRSSAGEFDDDDMMLDKKRKPILAMGEDCPTEETAAFLLKSTMVPIMEFNHHLIADPVKASPYCSCCMVESICKKRVAKRLPAMCEQIFASDLYLIRKHDIEELKSLLVIRE